MTAVFGASELEGEEDEDLTRTWRTSDCIVNGLVLIGVLIEGKWDEMGLFE